jgi:multiple sugar transport system permease protein
MYMGVLSLMMVPAILTIVPSYLIYSHLGLINTLWVLIIPQWTIGPVFGIFLLRGFFQTTPEEIFEAARMDGCGDFRLFGSISLPLSYPILTTLAIMNVVGVWNDLIWPSITIHDSSKMTIAYGLVQAFSTTNTTNMPDTFAGYVLASIPLLVIFAFASKYYVEGLTSSAIKL